MAQVVFSGNHDSDDAAEALRATGYEVHRMPASHPSLGQPLDDFIEAIIDGPGIAPAVPRATKFSARPPARTTQGQRARRTGSDAGLGNRRTGKPRKDRDDDDDGPELVDFN